jgi:hypothetical protein
MCEGGLVDEDELVEVEDEATGVGESVGGEVFANGGGFFCGGVALEGHLERGVDLGIGIGGGGFDAICEVGRHGDGELVVELGEGLEGGDGHVAFIDQHGGVGAIEGCHPRLLLAADDESVDGSSVDAGIFRVGEVVFVVGAVGWLIDDEVLEAGAFHGQVEFSCGVKDCIADGFSFETSPVLFPEQGVCGIAFVAELGGCGIRIGGLLIGFAGDDESVQGFEGSFGLVPEPACEPVEEFGVCGR